jgi:hypothetical protein
MQKSLMERFSQKYMYGEIMSMNLNARRDIDLKRTLITWFTANNSVQSVRV